MCLKPFHMTGLWNVFHCEIPVSPLPPIYSFGDSFILLLMDFQEFPLYLGTTLLFILHTTCNLS